MKPKLNASSDAGDTGPISDCPKCEKQVVKVRKYKNGDQLFVHAQEARDKPFPHIEIVDCCYVKAGG